MSRTPTKKPAAKKAATKRAASKKPAVKKAPARKKAVFRKASPPPSAGSREVVVLCDLENLHISMQMVARVSQQDRMACVQPCVVPLQEICASLQAELGVKLRGVVVADWGRMRNYSRPAVRAGLRQVQVSTFSSGKNAGDIALTIEAMALCHAADLSRRLFILMSGDSDFTPLIQHLQHVGHEVWVIAETSSAANVLAAVADRCIPVEDFVKAPARPPVVQVVQELPAVTMEDVMATPQPCPTPPVPQPLPHPLRGVLGRLGSRLAPDGSDIDRVLLRVMLAAREGSKHKWHTVTEQVLDDDQAIPDAPTGTYKSIASDLIRLARLTGLLTEGPSPRPKATPPVLNLIADPDVLSQSRGVLAHIREALGDMFDEILQLSRMPGHVFPLGGTWHLWPGSTMGADGCVHSERLAQASVCSGWVVADSKRVVRKDLNNGQPFDTVLAACEALGVQYPKLATELRTAALT